MVVLAAGAGTRFGAAKQFEVVGGVRLVDRVVTTADGVSDTVVVVLPENAPWDGRPSAIAVAGGPTRSASVRCGLAAAPPASEIIVVHDAAHPLASTHLFESVIAAVRDGADAAVPVWPVSETVKRLRHGRVVETVPRDGLVIVQTPHAFRADLLRRAHAGGPEAVDDTMLVEAVGGTITVVAGDPVNVHVTTPADLRIVDRLVSP